MKSLSELQAKIQTQRVLHIIDSYGLRNPVSKTFEAYLAEILATYPGALVELAIAELLVENWQHIPMVRGISFLTQVEQTLQRWSNAQNESVDWQQTDSSVIAPFSPCFLQISRLAPAQFSAITGLTLPLVWESRDV